MGVIAGAVAAFVGSIGVAGAAGLALGIVAAGYAYKAVQEAKKQSGSKSPSERKQTFRSANAPKQVILGENVVSGPIVFAQEQGSPNDDGIGEILHLVIPLAGHRCTECLAVWVGDLAFTKLADTDDGSHWVYDKDGDRHGQVWFYSRSGDVTEPPASLAEVEPWQDDMLGRNQTFLHARLRSNPSQWPSGVEDVRAKVRGAPVFDPRSGETVWSTNPALQARHYIGRYLLGKRQWVPNFNGVNAYIVIPPWKVGTAETGLYRDFSISGEFVCNNLYEQEAGLIDLIRIDNSFAYVLLRKNRNSNHLKFYYNGGGIGEDIQIGNRYTFKLTRNSEGLSQLFLNDLLVDERVQNPHRDNDSDGVFWFGRYANAYFKGQLLNVRMIDNTNPENNRFYRCVTESGEMPTTTVIKNELDPSGETDGEMLNFGDDQPWTELTHPHILDDTFIESANICDEIVVRDGVAEPRYSCHALFDEEEDPQQVLGNIAATMAGEFARSGGLWGARAGAYYGPATRQLQRDEAAGDLEIRVSMPLEDRVNTITGQYLEPDQNHNLTDFPAVSRPEYLEQDGRERVLDLRFDYVQSVTQAQALAWIELEKRRRSAQVSGAFKLSAVDAVMGRVLSNDFPGLSGLELRVVNWGLSATNGIQLELVEDHPDIWTGSPGDIVKPILPGNLPGNDPRRVEPVQRLLFTQTPEVLNQHGVLTWEGQGAEYEVEVRDGVSLVLRDSCRAPLFPLTLPVLERPYQVAVTAINAFGARSEPVQVEVSLNLAAPEITTDLVDSYDHWLEVLWPEQSGDHFELQLLQANGSGVYTTSVPASPARLDWFEPGRYRLRVRAHQGVTPSAWSNELTVQIDDLGAPTPNFSAETSDPLASGGTLSFSDREARADRVEYQVTGVGFHFNGDCPGNPVRLPPMLPGLYQFRARVQWRDIYSPWNTVSHFLSDNLEAPSNLNFEPSDAPGLAGRLHWQSEASQHRVRISGQQNSDWLVNVLVNGLEYQVPVLKVGDYQVEVRAIGRVSESDPATVAIAIDPPQAPADLVFVPASQDSALSGEVQWQPVALSGGYQVRLYQAGSILVESRVTDHRWPITNLSPGSYEVRVATISQREAALSDWSSVTFSVQGLDAPAGLQAEESLIGSGIQIISQVRTSCQPVSQASSYEFEYQALGSGSWSGIQSGPATSATLNAVPAGDYTFRVRALNGSRQSGYTSRSFRVSGTQRPPSALDNLRLHGFAGGMAQLSWDLSEDPDVLTGGAIHVRHTHQAGDTATWDSAVPVTDRLPGNATLASVPLLSGTYLVKPVNAGGYWSEETSAVVSNMAGLIGYNRIVERAEPEDWPGEKNKATVEAGNSLTLAENQDNELPPYYIMDEPLDLKAVITARLTLEVDASVYFADTIDERTANIDDWPLFDGLIPDDVSLRYEVSQTDDNPESSSAQWSEWTPFLKGEFRARGFRLRVSMQGRAPGAVATLVGLRLIADVPDRIESDHHLSAPTGGLRVDYQIPFLAAPAVGITAHAMPNNGRFELSNQDAGGFFIKFFTGNTAIACDFDYSSIGYGEAE